MVENCWKMSKIVEIFKKNCQNVSQVMFPHHSDQMSQRSQVSWIALLCQQVKWQEKYKLETLIFIIVLNSRCLCGGSLKLSYLVKTWNLEASKLQIRDLRHCLWALFWEFKLGKFSVEHHFCQEEIAFKIPRHGIAGGHSRQCGDTKLKEFDVYTIQK